MLLLPSWNPEYRMDREGSEGGGVQGRQRRARNLEVEKPQQLENHLEEILCKNLVLCVIH